MVFPGAGPRGLGFLPARFAQRLIEQELDLAIDTAKLIAGPFFESLVGFVVDAQHKTFLFAHME